MELLIIINLFLLFWREKIHFFLLFFKDWWKKICNITDGRRHWILAVSRLENVLGHQSSSVIGYMGLTIKNVTNLARAGRVTCRVQAWFWYNHAWTFTCYTTVFTGDHRTFENLRIDPSNRYCHVVSHWEKRNKEFLLSLVFELASRQRMTVKRDNVGQSRSNKSKSEWKPTDVCTLWPDR